MFMYNYTTDQYDELERVPLTDEEEVNYIPQQARALYEINRQLGMPILEAMRDTLAVMMGKSQ